MHAGLVLLPVPSRCQKSINASDFPEDLTCDLGSMGFVLPMRQLQGCRELRFGCSARDIGTVDCYAFSSLSDGAQWAEGSGSATPADRKVVPLEGCQATSTCSFSLVSGEIPPTAYIHAKTSYRSSRSSVHSGIRLAAGKTQSIA